MRNTAVKHKMKDRKASTSFSIDQSKMVFNLLHHLHHIREARYYRGDADAVIILLDLYNALQKAKLSRKQKQILFLAYELDAKQEEIGIVLNMSQQAVSYQIKSAIQCILKQL